MTPVECNCNTTWFRVLGHPYHGEHNDAPRAFNLTRTTSRLFRPRTTRGRRFPDADDASAKPVMVINQTLRKTILPERRPHRQNDCDIALSPESMRQIVGVVDDIREGGLDEDIRPAVYYPFDQSTDDDFTIVVRPARTQIRSAIAGRCDSSDRPQHRRAQWSNHGAADQ